MILFIYNHFRYYLQFQTIAITTNTSLQLLRLHAAINKDVIKMIENAFYYNKINQLCYPLIFQHCYFMTSKAWIVKHYAMKVFRLTV